MMLITQDGVKCERGFKKLRISPSEEVTGTFVLGAHKEDLSDSRSSAVMESESCHTLIRGGLRRQM